MEGVNWKRVYDGNLTDSLWVKGKKNDKIKEGETQRAGAPCHEEASS